MRDTRSTATPARAAHRQRWRPPFWLVVAVVVLASLALRALLVGVYVIPSESMQETLDPGDRVVVAKWRAGEVHRGDVVVFDGEGTFGAVPGADAGPLEKAIGALDGHAPENVYVKRVIGVGGDHVACCDARGRVTVNDQPLDEGYLFPGDAPSQTPFDVRVPAGRIWLLGDHRSASGDSRYHLGAPGGGTVDASRVIGPVLVRYWPLSRFGGVER